MILLNMIKHKFYAISDEITQMVKQDKQSNCKDWGYSTEQKVFKVKS